MTDHSRYKSPSGAQLTLRLRTSDSPDLDQRLFLMVDGRGMFIPTAELLAMIDAADPDAMRAYLRETLEHEVPEADSPEDVDERRLCDPLTDEQLAELRESGRTLGEAWRTFTDAVRDGRFGEDR